MLQSLRCNRLEGTLLLIESLMLVLDGARYHGDLRYWVRETLKIVLLGCMKKLV
jgi:hypothetical protein